MLNRHMKAFACLALCSSLALPAFAGDDVSHEFIQDAYKEGARVKIDEDQDEVFEAVRQGKIRPFSELYAAIDQQLNGRVIKVELDEDDDEWVYELKLVYDNKVIRVEYNAATLELMSIRGRNVLDVIKK
ncbi:PepSY domain-containing protein [Vibrio furnissii]|uniref:PepSY domain-containing protein n=1 Tax=Vibrio furnissii TaxID=29494 RepID=UPI001E57D636|nr:PepSY domain-containing protein [Vibrio furnissii]UHJ58950.1 PepSY domain-containing protein [Vibrio furnissii]